uniref:WAT1-related protein n=1 Tax=Aegilops tauschii subsp. strangulata TaxID=200361 RepID=A0A452ZEP1_AEGTS
EEGAVPGQDLRNGGDGGRRYAHDALQGAPHAPAMDQRPRAAQRRRGPGCRRRRPHREGVVPGLPLHHHRHPRLGLALHPADPHHQEVHCPALPHHPHLLHRHHPGHRRNLHHGAPRLRLDHRLRHEPPRRRLRSTTTYHCPLRGHDLFHYQFLTGFAGILQGIVTSSIAYYVQGLVIQKTGPVFASAFSPLMMIIVAVMGSFILSEKIYLGAVLGAVVIVVGLYAVLWGKHKETQEQEADAKAALPVASKGPDGASVLQGAAAAAGDDDGMRSASNGRGAGSASAV